MAAVHRPDGDARGPAAYALRLSEQEKTRYRRMAEHAVEREAELLRRAGIVGGAGVVDIGCGPGAMLVQLARLVGEGGEAVGVEPDPVARDAAVRAIADAELGNARVVEGNGTASGLVEGTWDAVMVRHVLFHVGSQAQDVVRHGAALVRPGGHVYLTDTDVGAMHIAPDDGGARELFTRYADFQRARGNNPQIGPRLHVLLAEAGLALVAVEAWYAVLPAQILAGADGGAATAAQQAMMAAGALTEEEAQQYALARERTFANPITHAFMPQFVAVGRRPG